jgi:hypothetical protein
MPTITIDNESKTIRQAIDAQFGISDRTRRRWMELCAAHNLDWVLDCPNFDTSRPPMTPYQQWLLLQVLGNRHQGKTNITKALTHYWNKEQWHLQTTHSPPTNSADNSHGAA